MATRLAGPVFIGIARLRDRTSCQSQAAATSGARLDVMRLGVGHATDLEKPNEIIGLLEAGAIYPQRPTLARSDVFKLDLSRL